MLIKESGLDDMYVVKTPLVRRTGRERKKRDNAAKKRLIIEALEEYVCSYGSLSDICNSFGVSTSSLSVYITKYFKKEEESITLRSRIWKN